MRSAVYASRFLRAFLLAMLVALLMTGTGLFAQERFSSIIGVVYDSSKAVLPGAEVTITNLETKRTSTIATTDSGRYLARDLEPGRYSVSAQKAGFAKSEYPDVILLLGKTINLDFTLQVGQVKETIVVSGTLTMIDTNTTAVTHNVTAEEFDYMPKSRTFQSVALTSPSVNSGEIEGGIQVNGASGAENQFTVDGISTTSLLDGSSRQDAQFEYLQEVQVKTSGLEAEYGGALGGVISAVTKSGGNEFHGEFHWYSSGSPFNVSPDPRLTTAYGGAGADNYSEYVQDEEFSDRNNEIGGSVGGYIVKDKLFFFTSFAPVMRNQESTIQFSDGPSTFGSDRTTYNLFNKISWDVTKRIRTNFAWLYNSTKRDGLLPAYNSFDPNTNRNAVAQYELLRTQGWYVPKNSYTGTVDFTVSNTALLSVRGGYFWDNYKDLGIPQDHRVRWMYDTTEMDYLNLPVEYQQLSGYSAVPGAISTNYDITSRGYIQGDYSQSFRFLGTHFFKAGAGFQKNVNNVFEQYNGGFDVRLYWDDWYDNPEDRGEWGMYRVINTGTRGSAGSTIKSLYIQNQWRIHPRLTLNLGLRTEHEVIPTMAQNVQKVAMDFNWGDKLAPRLGASFDILGDGKWKVFGSWGRFFDWTKFEMVRGSFGGDYWQEYWHALEPGTDVYTISPTNLPGANLVDDGPLVDYRIPSFGPDAVDPDIKPMYQDTMVVGTEYQLNPTTVFGVNYVRSRLTRTIEDIGRSVGSSTVYTLGNPGEGLYTYETNHLPGSATPDFLMPKPKRAYDALELSFTRRFSKGWFLGANYTYSHLDGNYTGLSDTDEIMATGWSASQTSTVTVARPGTNTALFYDSEAYLLDSHGQYIKGRLPTDRPHVFKIFGSYSFKWGTSVSANLYAGSGTPLTTMVENDNWDPMMVENRGDRGRTPTLSQTDLMVSHEFKIKESKTLRFEFNMMNLFNQRTVRHIDPLVNRFRTTSAGISIGGVYNYDEEGNVTEEVLPPINLLNGYNWQDYLANTSRAADSPYTSDPYSLDPTQNYAINPTYNKADVWNPAFSGRFGVKFIF
jgi:hypothetical protein